MESWKLGWIRTEKIRTRQCPGNTASLCDAAMMQGLSGSAGEVGGYSFLGFFQRAKQSATVTAVLDNLKENLRCELACGSRQNAALQCVSS